MATISVSPVLDGTTVNSTLTITVASRATYSVTYNYSIATHLNSSGSTSAGYETYTAEIKVSGTNITTKTQSVTLKEKSVGWSGSTVHTVSGSFTVTTANWNNLTATIQLTTKSSADSTHSGSGSTTLATGAGSPPYTACSAPTSVTISPSIVAPGGTITVSWSGAKSGTNNTISSYYIYFSNGTYQTIYTTKTSGSATFTAPNSRGSSYYAQVRTQGTAGSSYYSSWSSKSGNSKINTLPTAPTSSNKIVASTINQTTLTVTKGTDVDTSQTVSLYYATSSTGTKTAFTSGSTILTVPGTYYFWSHDGLEYSSSYSTATISNNIKPTISSGSLSGTYSIVNNNPAFNTSTGGDWEGYRSFPIITVSGTCSKSTGNFTIYLKNLTTNLESELDIFTATSSSFEKTYNIISNLDRGTKYKIGISFDDELESSDTVWIEEAIAQDSQTYNICIAPTPSLIQIYNQWANSNISGTVTSPTLQIFKKVRAKFSYDSDYLNTNPYGFSKATGETSNTPITINDFSTIDTNQYLYIDFELVGTPISGSIYNFQLYMIDKYNKSSLNTTLAKEVMFFIPSILTNKISIKPFTSNGTANISISKISDYLSTDYAIDTSSNWLSLYLIYDGNEIPLSHGSYTTSGDLIYIPLQLGSTFYETIKNVFPLKNGIYNVAFKVAAVNRFSNTTSATKSNGLEINFQESPSITFTSNSVFYKVSGSTYYQLSTNPLVETLNLKFAPTVNIYNGSSFNYTVQIARKNSDPIESEWMTYISGTQSFTNTSSYNTPTSVTGEFLATVGEISNDLGCYFRVIIEDINGEKVTSNKSNSFTRKKHTVPNLNISSIVINDTQSGKQFGITYNCQDLGINSNNLKLDESKIELIYKYEGNDIIKNWISTNSTTSIWNTFLTNTTSTVALGQSPFGNSQNVKAKVTTKCSTVFTGGTITTTKIFETSDVLVFNINPTVAYRSHFLGINTKEFSGLTNEDYILVINQASGREKIYFLDNNGLPRTIDLSTGKLDGFILEGSVWEE